jgi:hypothetical protein
LGSQPGQKVHETPSQPTTKQGGTQLSPQATREAEISRIAVPGQPGQKDLQAIILMGKQLGMLAHACHHSHGEKRKVGGS